MRKERRLSRTILGAAAAVSAMAVTAPVDAAEGDAVAGERAFRARCQLCHAVDPAKGHGIGPNLHGVFGREAGAVAGFKFSKAHSASGLTWDETTLETYLSDFAGTVPGTKKTVPGVRSETERQNIVAYLKALQ